MYKLVNTLIGLFVVAGIAAADAVAPLKEWDYSSPANFRFYVAEGIDATFGVAQNVKTPDGTSVGEFKLKKLKPEARSWDIQLKHIYDGGLKAGKEYELEFLCKGSASGVVRMCIAQADRPWTPLADTNTSFEVENDWRKVKLSFVAKADYAMPLDMPRIMLGDCGIPATVFFGPATLRELPKRLNLFLDKKWTLFLNVAPPEKFDSVPSELPGPSGIVKAQTISLTTNSVDLGKMTGTFKETMCAVLYNEFNSPESGRMRIGIAADWWMSVYANGEKLFDNFPAGNGSHSFVPDDHVVEMPVKAGRNVFAVKVLSGSAGWRFVCGVSSLAPDATNGVLDLGGLLTVRSGPDWKPVDMAKMTIKPGTALDFSSLTAERSPAGALGKLIVNPQGKLAFERAAEKPVRLFGFNSGLGSNEKWTKPAMLEFARSLALQGYNAMRLQGNEYFLVGAFKTKDRDMSKAFQQGVSFDEEGLDLFDYFLYCLKENGIYFNLDFMAVNSGYCKVQAWVPLTAADMQTYGFKTQLLFPGPQRDHWKTAVGMLLNHRNPYTGLCLKDDPALSCVEPFNEQDIRLNQKEAMKLFTPHFREYLKSKYTTEAAFQSSWKRPDLSFENLPDIDEAMLRKSDAIANDAVQFLIKTMSEANAWYYSVIRKNGYTGLVTQWDMIMRTMELPARAMMPAIAQHSYFAHPGAIPSKNLVTKSAFNAYCWGGAKNDIVCGQGSSLNSSFFRAAAAIRFLDRPFLMTEYSHGFPNRYRHELGLFFGAYAALQGWDALYQHGRPALEPEGVPRMKNLPPVSFEQANDPISRASAVITALAWLRGDVMESPHSVQLVLDGKTLFPKNILAALGDDYAKMAMLTKIGILYPAVIPLDAVGKATPALIIPVSSFSQLDINSWYASADNKDGGIFPGLQKRLKDANILSAGNKSDYALRLFQSETGEITLDGKSETLSVIAPRLEGALLKKNKRTQLGKLLIESSSRPASVVIASLDASRTLEDSKHLLLVFSTNALNSGMVFENASMGLMLEVGHLPVLMETAKLSLSLKRNAPDAAPKAYSLNLDGTRAEPIPCEVKDGFLKIDLDTSSLKYATPFFEITLQ